MKKYTFDTSKSFCPKKFINSDYFRTYKYGCWLEGVLPNDFYFIEYKGKCTGYVYKEKYHYFCKKNENEHLSAFVSTKSKKALGRLLKKLPQGNYMLDTFYYNEEEIYIKNNSNIKLDD